MKSLIITGTFLLASLCFSGFVSAQENHQSMGTENKIHIPSEIKWQDGPPSLPKGARFAVLEGDPSKEGFFTMRILMPDGYRIPPHTHPKVEHITVISGIFNFGMGEKFDQAATRAMATGTFGYWPAGMKHFVWVKGETIVQLHGIGPWKIDYLNPADDPRNASGGKK